jgi:pimeloyl-ACP methyl ester carboxylesterase
MANFSLPPAPARYRRARDADAEYGTSATPDWRTIDWPAHLHQVEIDGSPVNYVDMGPRAQPAEPAASRTAGPRAQPAEPAASRTAGQGELEPIVFVHGLAGQWQNWLENIPRFAQERRVIAPDLPGHGLTPMPRDQITISGYGRCVNALCEKLDLGRVDMVGNSMGGFVSAEVAIQFPERIDQLVLVSAAGIGSADVAKMPIMTIGRLMGAIATHTTARDRSIAARPRSRHHSLALVARYPSRLKPDLAYEAFFKGAGKPGFLDALRANLNYDFRDRLPEIRQPTLIVWGENDSIIPVRDAHEFERLIPDSRKVVMRATGHVPMAERPSTFNDLVLDFLAESGRASEREPGPGESQAA